MNGNNKLQCRWYSKENAITLITLIITIIVMLILAGVIISITTDEDDVFDTAKEATGAWNNRITTEDNAMQNLLAKRNEILGGTTSGGNGGSQEEPTDPDESTEPEDTVILPAGWESSKVADVVEEGTRKAPIPVGYTASQISTEDEISEGLVIYQTDEDETAVEGEEGSDAHIAAMESRNQYVWIPVDDINDMVMCKKNGTAGTGGSTCNLVYDVSSNQITCQTHGYSTETELTDTNIDTTGLAGRLYATVSSTTDTVAPYIYKTSMAFTETSKTAHRFKANSTSSDSTFREPDLVTTVDNNKYQLVLNESSQALASANALKRQLNNKFIEMAKSVAKYGGFYLSRFEPSYDGTNVISKKNKAVLAATQADLRDVLQAGEHWYGLYNKTLNSVEKGASVNSHMIWGCQYDQVIKFLGANGEMGHVNTSTLPNKTGYTGDQDVLNNIYDLEGNNFEWTAESYEKDKRVNRGFNYLCAEYEEFYPASHLGAGDQPISATAYTTRQVLYVQ